MTDGQRKLLLWGAVIAVICGVAFASLCVYIAFQENPNFYYYDQLEAVVQWQHVLPLFFITLLTAAVLIAVVLAGSYGIGWLSMRIWKISKLHYRKRD